jgi:hypothetical protein
VAGVSAVTIKVRPWAVDHEVEPQVDGVECSWVEKPTALLISQVLFDGEEVLHRRAEIAWEGPTELGREGYDFMAIWLYGVTPEFFDALSPDDYLLGSHVKRVGLMVSSLAVERFAP